MSFHRLIIAALLISASATLHAEDAVNQKAKPDARFGNVRYKTPDTTTWSVSESGGRRIFSAQLQPPDFCKLTIFPGGVLDGDFTTAFARVIEKSLGELRTPRNVADGGVDAGKAAEGFDVLQRRILAEGAESHSYHWFLAGHPGDRFDVIAFQTSSEEMYTKY